MAEKIYELRITINDVENNPLVLDDLIDLLKTKNIDVWDFERMNPGGSTYIYSKEELDEMNECLRKRRLSKESKKEIKDGVINLSNSEWNKVSEKLPESDTYVLCYDQLRGFTIGYVIAHPEVEYGRMWSINNAAGGIGTRAEVVPPSHWAKLPPRPERE